MELHHIIFRSQASYMAHIPINFIYLTSEDHRGKYGPHLNKKKDLELKRQLQVKLEGMFDKDYYTLEEITNKLEINERAAIRLVKTLKQTKEGYNSKDLIFHMLGDRKYAND